MLINRPTLLIQTRYQQTNKNCMNNIVNNEINIEAEYKHQVLKIWEKHKGIEEIKNPEFEYRKSPILPKSVVKNAILFVGINPSFTKGSVIEPENKSIEFYSKINPEDKEIQYFQKFKDVAKYCNNEQWTHIDLFFLRETNQKVIQKMSYEQIDFLQEQLNISFEIIEKSKPKIIIVANSLASEFFGKKKLKHHKFDNIWKGFDLNFDTNFDENIGTYKIKLGSNEVPIIFSGMLSGQRALDLGSLERLKWQIKMILNK